MADLFKTITAPGESKVTEKMSRFYGFALHAETPQEARDIIKRITNEYHDARHVCWAYMTGKGEERQWQCNDNGEPSGTAGKPILGQLQSFSLTDAVVVVVRYFGGIKLGTGGLTVAYRTAAREAIEAAEIEEMHVMAEVEFTFPYVSMNDIMKIAKQPGVTVVAQEFDNTCRMRLRVRADEVASLRSRLSGLASIL